MSQVVLNVMVDQVPKTEETVWKTLGVEVPKLPKQENPEVEEVKKRFKNYKANQEQRQKMDVDRLKKHIKDLEEIVQKRNATLKEKNKTIHQMTMDRKMEKKELKEEHRKEMRSVKEKMSKMMKNEEKPKEEEDSDDDYFSCEEDTDESMDFFNKIEMMWREREEQPSRLALNIQTNWINTFLDQNSEFITQIYKNHHNVVGATRMQIDQLEEKLEEAAKEKLKMKVAWEVKEAEFKKEVDNLKLRLRDAEYLHSLI